VKCIGRPEQMIEEGDPFAASDLFGLHIGNMLHVTDAKDLP